MKPKSINKQHYFFNTNNFTVSIYCGGQGWGNVSNYGKRYFIDNSLYY